MSSLEIYFLDRKNLNLLQSDGQEAEERSAHRNTLKQHSIFWTVFSQESLKVATTHSSFLELNTNIDLGQVVRLLAKHDWKNR